MESHQILTGVKVTRLKWIPSSHPLLPFNLSQSLAREVGFQPSRPLLPSPANRNRRRKRYPCVSGKPKVLESKSGILCHAQLEEGGSASVKWTWEAKYVMASHKLQAKRAAQQDSCRSFAD